MDNFASQMLEFYRLAGSKSKAARLLSERVRPITYQAMDKWIENRTMPATEYRGDTSYAQAIEEITDGKIRAYALCPVARYDTRGSRKAG